MKRHTPNYRKKPLRLFLAFLWLLPLLATAQPNRHFIEDPSHSRPSKYDIKAASAHPKGTAEYHYHVGTMGLKENYLGMARRHLTQAIELRPEMAHAYEARGWVYWFEREHDKALADFDTAIKKDPFIEAAWQGRAIVFRDKWELTLADADLTHVLELDPNDTLMIWLRGGIRYSRGEYYEAVKDLRMAYELDSFNCLYEIDLAYALLESGLATFAERHFDAMVQAGPCWPDALRGKLLCLIRSGRKEEAKAYAASATRPEFAAWLQSIIAHEEGFTGRALELEEIALDKGRSRLGWLNYTSGYYALQRGDRELAKKRLLTALRWGDFHIKLLARIEIEKGGFKIPAGMKY